MPALSEGIGVGVRPPRPPSYFRYVSLGAGLPHGILLAVVACLGLCLPGYRWLESGMLPEPLVAGDGMIVPGVGKDPSRTNQSPLLSTHSDTERETVSLLRPRALKSHATGSRWRQKPKQSKAKQMRGAKKESRFQKHYLNPGAQPCLKLM